MLYQSILNAKLTGRKNLGRKRCTSNRDDRKLENTVKQSWFKHLWELHKEWTEAGVSASRVTTLRRQSQVKVCFIVNSATCTVHTYREFKLRYSLTPWCIQITLNTNSQSSVVRGVREGRGGKDGREFSFLTAWWMKLSFSLLVLAWRLRSLLPDGSRLKKLCDGWVGSPAMQRALRVRRVL